jgi:hypothetical protein
MGDPFADAAARAAGEHAEPEPKAARPATGELVVRGSSTGLESQLPVVVDTTTGEVHDSAVDLPSDRLAELLYRIREAETNYKLWRRVAEDELRARLTRDGRREAVVGDYQLAVSGGRSRRWDAADLEGAVQGLIDGGALNAGEVADLIVREAKVNGTLARELLDRLTGPAHDVLASCFTWEDRRPSVSVEPVAQLPPGED